MGLKDLLFSFALFLVWGICGALLMALLQGFERLTGLRVPGWMYGGAVFGGLALAIGGLLWLDCALFVDLPFANVACQLVGY